MTWAQRLKRVFQIDIDTCTRCPPVAVHPQWVVHSACGATTTK